MPFLIHQRAEKIAYLNDRFRQSFRGGIIVLGNQVKALPDTEKKQLLQAVQIFSNFIDESDPYREHDFGCIWMNNQRYYFQIRCYDLELKQRSLYPYKVGHTKRVLFITRHDELQTTTLEDYQHKAIPFF